MVGWGEWLERETIHIYIWLIHVDVRQRPHCKAVILQLKKQNRNENPQIFDVLSTEIWTLFVTTAYTNWLIFFLKDEPTQGYRGLILKQEGRWCRQASPFQGSHPLLAQWQGHCTEYSLFHPWVSPVNYFEDNSASPPCCLWNVWPWQNSVFPFSPRALYGPFWGLQNHCRWWLQPWN